jgi:hypothetical protein
VESNTYTVEPNNLDAKIVKEIEKIITNHLQRQEKNRLKRNIKLIKKKIII